MLPLSDTTLREQEAHARKIRAVEIRAHASQIVVPTDQTEVRVRLRALGQPVTLFGEGWGAIWKGAGRYWDRGDALLGGGC